MNERWWDNAICKGEPPSIFFPTEDMSIHRWDIAFSFCQRCPVHRECLADAMKIDAIDDKSGMFGGLTPRERLMIRKGTPKFFKQFDDGTVIGCRV